MSNTELLKWALPVVMVTALIAGVFFLVSFKKPRFNLFSFMSATLCALGIAGIAVVGAFPIAALLMAYNTPVDAGARETVIYLKTEAILVVLSASAYNLFYPRLYRALTWFGGKVFPPTP